MPSAPVPGDSRASGLPYVLTDIMTYFTMLVGIYFPSVTGEAAFPVGLSALPLTPGPLSFPTFENPSYGSLPPSPACGAREVMGCEGALQLWQSGVGTGPVLTGSQPTFWDCPRGTPAPHAFVHTSAPCPTCACMPALQLVWHT